MTPKEITEIIEKEIGGDWSITNMHHSDLRRCLIRPKKRKISFFGAVKEIWIVLEERPETLDGFMVVFDEETKKFGLAQHTDSPGYYGYICNAHDTFLKAFDSM